MQWPISRKSCPQVPLVKNIDDLPILSLSTNDNVYLSQLYESLLIVGGSGSGKTTSVGAHVCFGLLKAGCSMAVFTVKPDEYARIKTMCDELGREVIRLAPGEKWRIDVLDYSLRQKHSSIDQVVTLLDALIGVANRKGADGRGDEPFWAMLARRIIRMCLIGTWYGNGRCSITDLHAFVTALPTAPEQLKSEDWLKTSFAGRCMVQAATKELPPEKLREFELACAFLDEWTTLSEKTKSIGYTMVVNILSAFMGGDVSTLISSGETNITPEEIYEKGLVVVIDYPILLHREPAQYMQIVLKTLLQRAVLRRDVEQHPIPLVLWIDEANWLIMPDADALTQSVGRASKLITVALFQNLPLLYRSFGSGEGARDDAQAWIGNFSTKIMCANSCQVTNEYFQNLCGASRHMYFSGNSQIGDYDPIGEMLYGTLPKTSGGFSEQWHPDYPASNFCRQKTGGPRNGFQVQVVAFQNGRIWSNGKMYLPATIRQRI